jgi:hypothetical protein
MHDSPEGQVWVAPTLIAIECVKSSFPKANRWPIRPWPMPDELLSSWLNRVAIANGIAPRSFYRLLREAIGYRRRQPSRFIRVKPGQRLQSIETAWVDLDCSQPLLSFLAAKTGYPEKRLEYLALLHSDRTLPPSPTPPGTLQWALIDAMPEILLPDLGKRRPSPDFGYLRFCPRCLSEWPDPWFRKFWRTSLAKVCLRHRSVLHTTCTCGADVRPHLAEDAHAQAICYACKNDLRTIDDSTAKDHQIFDQQEISRRAYDEVEQIVLSGKPRSSIRDAIHKPTPSSPALRRAGLIDVDKPNSPLTLSLIYHQMLRHQGAKAARGQAVSS